MVKVLIHLRLDLQQWDEEKEMELPLKVSRQKLIEIKLNLNAMLLGGDAGGAGRPEAWGGPPG